jgi:hypothetical protein
MNPITHISLDLYPGTGVPLAVVYTSARIRAQYELSVLHGIRLLHHARLKFRHRVAVETPCGSLLFMADPALAIEILDGGASIYSRKDEKIAVIRLAEHQLLHVRDQGLWPGSYGIHEEHFSAGRYFEHRNTREGELTE